MTSNLNVNSLQSEAIKVAKTKLVDALDLFRPTEQQEEVVRTMSLDNVLEVLLGGGNRSGKTVLAAVMMASALRNKPITFRDGSKHWMRPERWRASALKVWIVGYDWTHIGKTMHRVLLKSDLFKIIRDQKTGKWRAWNPDLPEDKDLYGIARPSPPLIRPADITNGEDGISWENKKDRQLKSFEMAHDGSRIEFFASTGAKPQGDPAHIIWMDEKIEDEGWYTELLVRLTDYRGRLLWTTWPTTAPSATMTKVAERAERQRSEPNRKTYSFKLKGSDNPYTKSDHREAIYDTMDEDERKARDEGELNSDRWRIYARFSRYVHRVMGPDPSGDDELAKTVRTYNGIPGDWTRYLILDPGTKRPAILLVAVPPDNLGDFVVPYDEIYIPRLNAKELAQASAAKTKGFWFEDFIIDAHAARQTPMGFDGTVGMNYEKEFAAAKLSCRRHGSRFSFGSDNITTRIMGVQGDLSIRPNGTPRIRVLGCPNLVNQMEHAKWGSTPKEQPTEEPAKYQELDLVNCLEYFISRDDCGYVKPQPLPSMSQNPRELMHGSIKKQLGLTNTKKEQSRSVYCGAGSVESSFM